MPVQFGEIATTTRNNPEKICQSVSIYPNRQICVPIVSECPADNKQIVGYWCENDQKIKSPL